MHSSSLFHFMMPSARSWRRGLFLAALLPGLLGAGADAHATVRHRHHTSRTAVARTAYGTRGAVLAPGARRHTASAVHRSTRRGHRTALRSTTRVRSRATIQRGARASRRGAWHRRGRHVRRYYRPSRWTVLSSSGETGPWVYSAAALLVNVVTGTVVYQRNADVERPVASLTKLMTTLTFLDTHPDLDQQIVIQRGDVYRVNVTRLHTGEVLRLRDALHAALMVSDNGAARALARYAGGGDLNAFVFRMNERARSMGLTHTRFVEPTGLDPHNVSTARELAAMVTAAAHDPVIAGIMQAPEYGYWSNRRYHHFGNTNHLLASRWEVRGGKTGYTSPAGYCFAACLADGSGREFAGVVLGAPTGATRFADVSRMMSWATAH